MARTQGSYSGTTGPRIRAAALALFARHGFAAVSMRRIAGEVGLQVGALYNHTPDKQSLLFELMQGHLEDLLSAWAEVPRPPDPMAALEQFTRFHIRFHSARPDAVFVAYMELRNLSAENFAEIERLRDQYEQKLRAVLHAGRAAGLFEVSEVKLTTMAIIAMLNGVNTWFKPDGGLNLKQVEDLYWQMVRKTVAT